MPHLGRFAPLQSKMAPTARVLNPDRKFMRKNTSDMSEDVRALVEDAGALLKATADVAGDKVGAARKRLEAALHSARGMAESVCEKSRAGARAADAAVRENPYQAIAIGVGVGAILGFLLARQRSARRD